LRVGLTFAAPRKHDGTERSQFSEGYPGGIEKLNIFLTLLREIQNDAPDRLMGNIGGHSSDTVTVRVPMTFRKRGGRKQVIAPEGAPSWVPARARVDNTMIKALARAFRWRKVLETGVYATVEELATAEKINASYVSRVLRLTLLAPDIVEAILDGRQPAEMTLAALMRPFAVGWGKQVASNKQHCLGSKWCLPTKSF